MSDTQNQDLTAIFQYNSTHPVAPVLFIKLHAWFV
jgi:hypothetical protein